MSCPAGWALSTTTRSLQRATTREYHLLMRDITFSELQRIETVTAEAEALQMDQDTFRVIYDRTARPLWVYLFRRTGSSELADDLLQETYYRFLRMNAVYESESHRKN